MTKFAVVSFIRQGFLLKLDHSIFFNTLNLQQLFNDFFGLNPV